MENLGTRIQELRKKEGISQQDLALTIKVSKSMINRYENKNIQPPADILNRIANTLNTSVDFLINGHKDEKAIASLKDVEVLKQFKEVEQLEECDRNALLKVITGFIRDCKAKQTYAV